MDTRRAGAGVGVALLASVGIAVAQPRSAAQAVRAPAAEMGAPAPAPAGTGTRGSAALQNAAPSRLGNPRLGAPQAGGTREPTAAGQPAQPAAQPPPVGQAPAGAEAGGENPRRLGRPYPPPAPPQALEPREPPPFYVAVVRSSRRDSNVHQKIGRGHTGASFDDDGTGGNLPLAPPSVPMQ